MFGRIGLQIGAVSLAAMVVGGASAAGDEVARGYELASRWCVGCHVIAPDAAGGDVGPPFPAVAARPGQSAEALKAWLADPHPPMPDLQLTAPDFDALAAYILSLRPAD